MPVDDVMIVGAKPCMEVTSTQDPPTVTIADTCSTPCCGCSELNFVESAIATISKSISTLNSYAEALKTRLSELDTNIKSTKTAIDAYPHND